MNANSSGDIANHNSVISTNLTNPICQSPLEYDSKVGREVYMVAHSQELPENIAEEIAYEAEEENA
jgi:hypothetical protein